MRLSSMSTRVLSGLLTTFAFLALAMGVYAQGSSSVSGSVVDGQGNAVPGATVTLMNTAQNTQRTTTTSSDGAYTFSSVAPGTYALQVEAAGFKKTSVREVQALVDKPTTIPVRLEVGDVSAVVEVNAGSIESIANTQDASLGNNFVSAQISQLPLEGRNVADLLSLQPAVTPGGYVAGGRSDQANITLDGVDVNNQQEGTAFSPVVRVTPDSVEEFRVTTSNPDATRGRSSGAQISLVTKSGTNDFHGNLFWYHRNDYFNANDWFNNAAGVPRESLKRHLYGGSLGGPILKDKLFFFYNYEGMQESKSTGTNQLVPLASLGQGNVRFFDTSGTLRVLNVAAINSFVDPNRGNAPVVDVNPNVLALFSAAAAKYPSNNTQLGDGQNTGGFRWNVPLPVELSTHTARFDWTPFDDQKHTFSGRMNYQQDLIGNGSVFPDTPPTDQWSHPLGIAASHTWLIKNNLTNRFNYGLTRLAFSNQGDSGENAVTFRDVFSPAGFTRTFSRVNPTQNFADDMTWIKGNHTIQFGTNIRFIRNKRTNWTAAYDSATTNFGFYFTGGSDVSDIINNYLQSNFGTSVSSAWLRSAQSPFLALTGRLNQYTARFNFDVDGNPVPNTPTVREFATEEYDFYVQDSWKIRPSLTVSFGLRYGYSTPVYETQGLEAAPNIGLDEYFQRRLDAASIGQNYNEPILVELSGKKNGKPAMYKADVDNFQPRVSVAWSPNFEGGLGAFIFGKNRTGVLRGGFAMTNDYYGQQLAVSFDAGNTLGFLSNYTTPANTFNLSTNPAPSWTGGPMNIQQFPNVVPPAQLVFPLQQPQDLAMRIESSIDRGIQAPVHYSTNITYGRELPGKMYFEASWINRTARNLLARRDIMSPNNLTDPLSGMTYYEAGAILGQHAQAGGTLGTVPNLPFFNNLWAPGSMGAAIGGSWATLTNSQVFFRLAGISVPQGMPVTAGTAVGTGYDTATLVFDEINEFDYGRPGLFYQSQYGALDSFGSIANSDYNGGAFTLRQRLSMLTWDLNYTFSHSMDDTSGLQTSAAFGTAFILNPIRQRDNYASSDFDMRHIVNFNSLWQIPFGRGRQFLSNTNAFVDAVLGGWQLASIFRYNSGQPIGTGAKIFDNAGWATNWNLKSAMIQVRPIETGVHFNGEDGLPTMFADPDEAYRSFRSPYPGETGDRNQIRYPSFWTLDLGLQKSFGMPWYEGHKFSVRWDVFNVTNTPIFVGNSNTAMGYRPNRPNQTAPVGFGQFTGTRNDARIMQFAFRYDF